MNLEEEQNKQMQAEFSSENNFADLPSVVEPSVTDETEEKEDSVGARVMDLGRTHSSDDKAFSTDQGSQGDIRWNKSDSQLDRQLKSLMFENPGPANQWDGTKQTQPARRSHRTKKQRKAGNNDSSASDQEEDHVNSGCVGHTKKGYFRAEDGRTYDLCDCLNSSCPGCHFPCEKCQSPKCGRICRQNRKSYYIRITTEGTNAVVTNPCLRKNFGDSK